MKKPESDPVSEETLTRDPLADVVGKVDLKLEEDGEWFTHPPLDTERVGPNEIDGYRHLLLDENGNGLRGVRVRSTHCKGHKSDAKSVQQRALRMSPKQRSDYQEEMRIKLLAKHCVVEWDFTDRQGNAIPISVELVERLLSEDAFRHHATFIQIAVATHQGDFQRNVEEDEGN